MNPHEERCSEKFLDDCSPSHRGQFSVQRNKRKILWKLMILISDGTKTKKRGSRSCRAG
jgi:hypothetical protein